MKAVTLRLKRTIDLAAGVAGLAVLALPLGIIAAAIKLDSRGPVFFRQERIGQDGKAFRIWKFRSMTDKSEHTGMGYATGRSDPRITRVGRVLRPFSLDELPQLFNIITGEMSLVGPRPTLKYQVDQYTPHQRRRLAAKPGMTSLASVRGRNDLPWAERIELDVWYVDHWSLWLDLKILVRTPWVALVSREGAYASSGANDDFVQPAPGGPTAR
ncbi:MAG TPA: sugar transferase [Dehalococcoidia bacterium]|nr:sugar transferase [Dehalococcoidia bacterium]